ncbi:MAG: DUF1579 domain-containing protein [Ferruginibacter sp.]
MKNFIIACSFCSFTLFSCGPKNETETAVTDNNMGDSNRVDTTGISAEVPIMDSAKMMENWASYMTPGDMQKMMSGWSGNWKQEVTVWETPGGAPQSSLGRSENKMVMGGRYQQSMTTGKMMGKPFNGLSTLAFDKGSNTFINTWIDNMGTGMMILKGTWDDATKSINLSGNIVDPASGNGNTVPIRESFHIIDDNTQLMEMFGPSHDGKEFKMMEIKMTRM